MVGAVVASPIDTTLPSVDDAETSDASETPGNPPRVLIASSIDSDGRLELVAYRTIYIGFEGDSYNHRSVRKVSLKDVKIRTVGGKRVTLESARQSLATDRADFDIL